MISPNSLGKYVMILVLGSSAVHAAQPESLNPTLESYLKEFGLPAIAAAVFKEGVIIASGACGLDWSSAPVITHSGSNGMNLAIVMIWLEAEFGFVMMTNVAGAAADEALRKLAADLYRSFFDKPPS